MDFWGFESTSKLPGDAFGLFERPGAPGAKGVGGGAKKVDDTPPPPVTIDELKDKAPPDQSPAVVVLKFRKKEGKNVIYDPTRLFTMPAFFRNRGGDGIDTQEERDDVMKDVEDLPDYKRYVSEYDPEETKTPPAEVFVRYQNADGTVTEVPLSALNNLPEAADADPLNGGYGLDIWQKDLVRRLDELKERDRRIDLLIEELVAAIASGDIDKIRILIRLFREKAGIDAMELASSFGEAVRKTSKVDEETNKAIVDILKRGAKDPQDQAKLHELRNKLQLGQEFKETFASLLKDAYARLEEFGRLSNSIDERDENRRILPTMWGRG